MPEPSRQLSEKEYPASLREIPDPPKALYAKGTWPPLGTRMLTVVGSRALSPYGREACEKLIAGLAGYPISVVSGLALGADGCAHKAALRAGLHTIAIPGSGLGPRCISPRTHAGLAQDIVDAGGLLLSEHPDEYVPHPYDFPSRNRIMVGLSDAVLVIEAGAQSGTLITARLTHEYNRELLCVPHRIGDAHGFGAHLFIRLGATLVSETAHILEALHLEPKKKDTSPLLHTLSKDEKKLYELLAKPHARDELIRASGLPSSDALAALLMLELKSLAKEEFGAWRRV